MNHNIKKHVSIIVIALILAGNVCAQTAGDSIMQIRIDPLLELKFNQVGGRFCTDYQEIFKNCTDGMLDDQVGGIAVCEVSKVDTLNIHELTG